MEQNNKNKIEFPLYARAVKGLTFDFNPKRLGNHHKIGRLYEYLVIAYEITYFITRFTLFMIFAELLVNTAGGMVFFVETCFWSFCARWVIRAIANAISATFS